MKITFSLDGPVPERKSGSTDSVMYRSVEFITIDRERMEAMTDLQTGDKAPEFCLPDKDGETFCPDELKGGMRCCTSIHATDAGMHPTGQGVLRRPP